MKLEKMNWASMQKLTRGEMKKIMAGSGDDEDLDSVGQAKACENKSSGASCTYSGKSGICVQGGWVYLLCNIG